MEGLEISEILLSELDHIKKRLDSEYYQKKYLLIDSKIRTVGETNLLEINAKLDCSAFYPSITEYYDFEGTGIPFLRVNEINNGLVKITETTAFLPQHILDNNKSTIAIGYPGDMIIAKGGNTLAKVGLITSQYEKYALSRDIILVRTSDIEAYNKYFLWLFMHSDIGQSLLWRTASQTGQPHLTLPSINEIKLPKYKIEFEVIAEKLYKQSVDLHNRSRFSYSQAETLLLETLRLKDFKACKEPVNIKCFAESFGASGRLDAEYYQHKYENYNELIGSYSNGIKPLGEVCTIKDKNFKPSDELKYKYIELSNIGKSGEIKGCSFDFGSELPSRARRQVNTNDVIISSIEGSLESCALVSNEFDNSLCSTGFYVLTSSLLNPETLLVLFKSEPMQNLLKKGCSGTILTAIGKPELIKIPIPLIDDVTQESIQERIIESSEMRIKSEQLLVLAKTAVEKAIEENEVIATNYINEKLTELKININHEFK